jgi:segregation and condensation protein B
MKKRKNQAAAGDLEAAQPVPLPGDDDVTNRVLPLSADGEPAASERAEGEDPTAASAVDASVAVAELADSLGPAADQDSAPEPLVSELEVAPGEGAPQGADGSEVSEGQPTVDAARTESILESLLFAADRPLVLNELKRLLGERDGKRVTEALESLRARRADSGIQLVSVAGGWQLRTHPGNGAWVAKLVAGRPTRLSRAMMETLAIVAYRQPITRPEIDEIRGVDCGPVLHTLLDRGLIRVIGKKEEVGRPMLYGTTPEFLKIFSLRDLADLPTLREFHELGADERAQVDATASAGAGAPSADPSGTHAAMPARDLPPAIELPDADPEEEEALLEALEHAAAAAGRATQSASDSEAPEDEDESAAASNSAQAGDR